MLIKILPAFPFNKPVRKKVTKTVSKTTIGTLYLNGEVILKSGITIHKLELLDKNGEEFPKKYPKQLYPTLIWSSHNEPMKANYSNYPTLIHSKKLQNREQRSFARQHSASPIRAMRTSCSTPSSNSISRSFSSSTHTIYPNDTTIIHRGTLQNREQSLFARQHSGSSIGATRTSYSTSSSNSINRSFSSSTHTIPSYSSFDSPSNGGTLVGSRTTGRRTTVETKRTSSSTPISVIYDKSCKL